MSFFILRTHDDFAAGWNPQELSLIAFPYERLFTEQLETFDVVIFQNFDFKPYFERDPNGLLGNIVRFVREGGAFVMVGGDRSFDLGEYADTPIAGILPVRLGVGGTAVSEVPSSLHWRRAESSTRSRASRAAWRTVPSHGVDCLSSTA